MKSGDSEGLMRLFSGAALAAILGALHGPAMACAQPAADAVHGLARQGGGILAAAMAETEYTIGALRIKAPWTRATAKGAKVAGGYVTIVNTSDKPDRLMSIESDLAATVEVHEMSMKNGVMTMRPVDKPLEIAPGATLELKPGGYHVMFTDLKRGVAEGDKVKATLVFEKAGRIEIEFVAGGLGVMGPSHKM
jgi:copper(I)-binding protein